MIYLSKSGFWTLESLHEQVKTEFDVRVSLENILCGKKSIEFKRKPSTEWYYGIALFSNELKKFLRRLKFTVITPKLINQLINTISSNSPVIATKNYINKIIDLRTEVVKNIRPVSVENRQSLKLKKGQVCYVSFDFKRNFFFTRAKACPAIIDSIYRTGDEDFYDVLVFDKKDTQIWDAFMGRFLLKANEIGLTPVDAVKNSIISQAIF